MPSRGATHPATAGHAIRPFKKLRLSQSPIGDEEEEQAAAVGHKHQYTGRQHSASSSKERRRVTVRAPGAHLARRSSLPRPASPRPRQRFTASPARSTSFPSRSAPAARPTKRGNSAPTVVARHSTSGRPAGKALASLPTNTSTHRTVVMPTKRTRDLDAAALSAPRMTRRTSGAALVPEEAVREDSVRGRKRKREVKIISDTEMADDDEAGEEEDVEMDDSRPSARRLRSADAGDGDEENARQGDDEDEWSESEDDAAASDGEDQDDYCLFSASAGELRRLLRDELARLYTHATSHSATAAASLNKEQLIQAIVDARPDDHEKHGGTSSDDGSDGSDSPRPFTSHEASPVAERGSRDGKHSKRRGGKRISRREQHVPTPPRSSGSASTSQGDDDAAEPNRNTRALRNRSHSLVDAGSRPTSDQSKKGSRGQAEPPRRQLRTRRDSLNEEELAQEVSARELRNGKKVVRSPPRAKGRAVKFGREEQDEELFDVEEEDEDQKTSPVAHRTRHGIVPSSPVASPESRPGRAAKAKAVAKLVKSRKGKERAVDQDSSEEDELVDVPSDDDEELGGDGDEEMADVDSAIRTRAAKTANGASKRRGGRSKTQQVETPPSDADEESGAEPDDDQHSDDGEDVEEVSAEVTSHLRGPRQLRNGKVVTLRRRPSGGEEIVDSDDEAEEDMEMEEGEEQEDGLDLKNATSKSLLRCRRDDLLRLCEERAIDGEGTKADLVQALLQWRESHDESDGTASDTSTATARAETKTQALEAIRTARPRKSRDPPLLMRGHFSSSPEKPHSPVRSKAGEQEEVNALDLESLQLQDKEIAPEKLTKLEKVGSGGFKDVYKGIYRKKTIAIADIRGHLTDMDIKELGLLRDLRHPNIVHFIGVSIPKEPSSVPVMIVTELCANGDLFDYLRGVDHPPFLNMLEIMLGISRGLEYLHTHKPIIIHRDIKSSNVLITADGVAKLNDFGLARIKNSTRSMIRSLVGTVNWQAPELWVAHPKYNEKVDVYSVGLVFWEVLQWHQPVKRYPFEGLNEHAIYDQVGHKKIRPSTASMRRAWGGEVVDLVSAMWDADPASRPPMSQVSLEIEVLLTAERERLAQEKRGRA